MGPSPQAPLLEASLTVEGRDDLLERCYPNGRLGGLTVPGRSPGALGQRVKLTVTFRQPERQFVVLGQLAWARHPAGANLNPGFGLDFIEDDNGSRIRLLAFARREVASEATRTELRHPVELPVKLLHEGRRRNEIMADLSIGGAFVRTWDPLPVGALVQLSLRPRLSLLSLELTGSVAWARPAGEHPGMGIEFDRTLTPLEKLEKFLQKLTRPA